MRNIRTREKSHSIRPAPHRISRAVLWLAPILLVILLPVRADAQYSTAQPVDQNKSAHDRQTVTGCLQKGDEPGGFVLSGDDGKVWELKSGSDIKLAENVGHKVKVTGSRFHESTLKEETMERDEKKEAGGKEYADLKVA